MSTWKNRWDAAANASLAYPEVLALASVYYTVTERSRAVRKSEEKGAVSIEQAIITIAVIAFAIVVLLAISAVVKTEAGNVQAPPTIPNGT